MVFSQKAVSHRKRCVVVRCRAVRHYDATHHIQSERTSSLGLGKGNRMTYDAISAWYKTEYELPMKLS